MSYSGYSIINYCCYIERCCRAEMLTRTHRRTEADWAAPMHKQRALHSGISSHKLPSRIVSKPKEAHEGCRASVKLRCGNFRENPSLSLLTLCTSMWKCLGRCDHSRPRGIESDRHCHDEALIQYTTSAHDFLDARPASLHLCASLHADCTSHPKIR